MIFSGFFDLPWWGYGLLALGLTHITIAAVTIYLTAARRTGRWSCTRRVAILPALAGADDGDGPKEWAAIHRKHHAKCETARPAQPAGARHQPRALGRGFLVREGVLQQGHARALRARHSRRLAGAQCIQSPSDGRRYAHARVQPAGVRRGPGRSHLGYPDCLDTVLGGRRHQRRGHSSATEATTWRTPAPTSCLGASSSGARTHNNHHALLVARLSSKGYEFDVGWMYIRLLEMCGLRPSRSWPRSRACAPKRRSRSDTRHP